MLENLLNNKVLVAAHVGDADACASFVALAELIRKSGSKAKLTFTITGALNMDGRRVLQILKFKKLAELKNINPEEFDKLILVDTRPESLPEADWPKDIIVLDHHEKGASAAATTEVIYGLYKKEKVKPSSIAAKAIIFGLFADTAGWRFANSRTFSIIAELMQQHRMDYQKLLSEFIEEKHFSERLAILKAAQRMRVERVGEKIIAVSSIGSFESSAASKLITLGADVALVVSEKEKDVRIIGRSRTVNLAEIFIKTSLLMHGHGGGHPKAAVLTVPLDKKAEALKTIIKEVRECLQ